MSWHRSKGQSVGRNNTLSSRHTDKWRHQEQLRADKSARSVNQHIFIMVLFRWVMFENKLSHSSIYSSTGEPQCESRSMSILQGSKKPSPCFSRVVLQVLQIFPQPHPCPSQARMETYGTEAAPMASLAQMAGWVWQAGVCQWSLQSQWQGPVSWKEVLVHY